MKRSSVWKIYYVELILLIGGNITILTLVMLSIFTTQSLINESAYQHIIP